MFCHIIAIWTSVGFGLMIGQKDTQKIKQLINSDILNNNAKYLGYYSQFLKCDDFLPFCALHQTEYNLSWGHFKGKIDRLINSKYDCELNTVPWGKQDAFLEIYSVWFVLQLVAMWKPRRYFHLFPTMRVFEGRAP